MGNLISWLANRNGSPGQCVCELTISSGKKTEASKNAKKRTTQMHPQTQHKKSLYISPTHTRKMSQVQLELNTSITGLTI